MVKSIQTYTKGSSQAFLINKYTQVVLNVISNDMCLDI